MRSVTVVAVSVGPAQAPVTAAATLTPAAVVVSGASIPPTPGLELAPPVAAVPSSSGEPTAPASALAPRGRSPGPRQSHLGTRGIGYQTTCQSGRPGSAAHPQTSRSWPSWRPWHRRCSQR